MTSKKCKLQFNNIPSVEKPRRPDFGKLAGSAVLLSACGKGKPGDYPKKSMPRIVDNEDGTQTIVRPEKSVGDMFGNFSKEDAAGLAYDAVFIAAVLLVLRFSKIQHPEDNKGREGDRG